MSTTSQVRRIVALLSVFAALYFGAALLVTPAGASAPSDAVTKSVTLGRVDIGADGVAHTLVKRHKVTVTVDHTTDVRGREELAVSWTGAHPTGGLKADVNSGDAAQQEYPFVLLECRGTASVITPQTCWTQTSQERYAEDNQGAFPPYRVDAYATTHDRGRYVNQPKPLPKGCFGGANATHWVPFVAEDKTVYEGGPGGCAGVAPEAANVGGAGLPSNATYGVTATDGSGAANFDVFTEDENASLGCSIAVACSLVAIPIDGIDCDAYGSTDVEGLPLPDNDQVPAGQASEVESTCAETGAYAAGQQFNAGLLTDTSVSGALWWSASNWRNRIAFPLSFATPSSVCAVVNSGPSLNIYGSVIFSEATAQWQPKFCTDKSLFSFTHVQTGDPAARNLISNGAIEAAFSSEAPTGGFARPTVQAPVAVSGFAITYDIDDAKHNAYHQLRLDPRLLAKLLTESYPADPEVRDNYAALAGNPLNITHDPEFRALNPGLPELSNEAAAEMINISSEADLTYALTSYINADPEARAWLDGTPDPWGMVVNPHYKKIALPVSAWPLLDTFLLPKTYIDSAVNACYTNSPSPWLSLIANPTALLPNIAQDMQFALSNAEIVCPNGDLSDPSTLKMQTQGRQATGSRFLIGVTSLGDVHRYGLTAAALETTSTVSDPSARFTGPKGREFVLPTDSALRSAAALFAPDDTAGAWDFPYDDLNTGGRAAGAYPGTMFIYADVPTSGLPTQDAAKLAKFLLFAAGPGQQAGLGNGQLPPGYLPITAANNLEPLAAYTTRAAAAVAAQKGEVPAVDGSGPATTSAAHPSDSPSRPSSTPSGQSSTHPGTSPTQSVRSRSTEPIGSAAITSSGATSARTRMATTGASVTTATIVNGSPAAIAAEPAAFTGSTGARSSPSAVIVLPFLFGLTFLGALLAPAFRYPHLLRRPRVLIASLLSRSARP